jgi:DNA-binding MarR family transcriptional regulator
MYQADPFLMTLQRWIGVFMRRSMRHIMAYTRESGLSMAQLGALFQIDRRGGCSVTDLGDDLGVTSSAASQLLERLAQQGLIVRAEDPSDRRAKQIALTDRGTLVLQESIRARQGWLADLAGTLSEAEKSEATAALNILIERTNHLGRPEAGR